MVDREPSEGARQCVAARERGTGLEPAVDDPVGLDQVAPPGAGRRRFVGDPDQPDPGVTPQGMTGGMDEHRPQPRLEGQRVAKPRQVPPDHHERLLHDVVGIDPVASDRPNKAPGTVDMARHELGERLVVAPLCALDESALATVLGHYGIGPHGSPQVQSLVGGVSAFAAPTGQCGHSGRVTA